MKSFSLKKLAVLPFGLLALGVYAPSASALTTVTNGFYDAHIGDTVSGNCIGCWNAITAASHPTGAGNNLLFNQTTVSTNFSSLRVYGAAGVTDYTMGRSVQSSTNMDSFFTSQGGSAFGANGTSQTWNITPAGIQVVQDVIVTGTTFANSAIYHTVQLTNTGTAGPVSVGWRNLYDWAVNDPAFDDGPSNSIETTSSTVVAATTNEFSHTPGAGEFVRVAAAPPPVGGPTYEPLLGIGFDPAFIAALAMTVPEEYAFVSWPGSVSTSFDYTPSGANVTGDSAGLSWYGRTANSALSIGAGQSIRLTQVIFAVPPGQQPPGVPEPATLALLGLGLAGLGAARRRRT